MLELWNDNPLLRPSFADCEERIEGVLRFSCLQVNSQDNCESILKKETLNVQALMKHRFMYRNGKAVEQSDEEAVNWYRKAAEQGSAKAQNNFGWMYRNGKFKCVKQSTEEARKS